MKKGFLALDIGTGGPHPLSHHQPCIRSSPDKGRDPVDNISTMRYIYTCQGNASTSWCIFKYKHFKQRNWI